MDDDWKWNAKDIHEDDSISTFSQRSSIVTMLDDKLGKDQVEKCDSQISLLQDLKKLKVKSNREDQENQTREKKTYTSEYRSVESF